TIASWLGGPRRRIAETRRDCVLVDVDGGHVEAGRWRCRIQRGRVGHRPLQDAGARAVIGEDGARAKEEIRAAGGGIKLASGGLRRPDGEACAVRTSASRVKEYGAASAPCQEIVPDAVYLGAEEARPEHRKLVGGEVDAVGVRADVRVVTQAEPSGAAVM